MSGKNWTDDERYILMTAAKLYGRQWYLIHLIEFENKRTYAQVRQQHRSCEGAGWAYPEHNTPPKLKIEVDPQDTYEKIRSIIAGTGRRSTMPECLQHLEADPDEHSFNTPEQQELQALERKLQSSRDRERESKKKHAQGMRDETLFLELEKVLKETVSTWSNPPSTAAVHTPGKTKTLVHGVALLGDEHGDAVVDSQSIWGLDHYDFNIFRTRIEVWARLVVDYINVHLPRHHMEHLWVFKLGDGIQGDIHEATKDTYFRNALKGALAVGEVEADAINWIQSKTGVGITVIGVSGNHPRRSLRKDYGGPQDNFDFLIAAQIETRLAANDKVKVWAPNSWTAFADVLGKIWCINHGDDVVGFAGHPWYGFDRKNQRVQALVARKGFRVSYYAYGHYHTDAKVPSAGAKSYHNGGWYFTDVYAINKLSVGDEPQQNFYICSEKRGVIFEIPIQLKDTARENLVLEGKVEPIFGQDIVVDRIATPGQEFHIEGR